MERSYYDDSLQVRDAAFGNVCDFRKFEKRERERTVRKNLLDLWGLESFSICWSFFSILTSEEVSHWFGLLDGNGVYINSCNVLRVKRQKSLLSKPSVWCLLLCRLCFFISCAITGREIDGVSALPFCAFQKDSKLVDIPKSSFSLFLAGVLWHTCEFCNHFVWMTSWRSMGFWRRKRLGTEICFYGALCPDMAAICKCWRSFPLTYKIVLNISPQI